MKSGGNLATVGRYGAVWEADIVRDRLEAAGIQAFVQGSETGRSLSYIGVALGGVRVQVAARDVEAARRLLSEDARQRATAGDWQCPRCDEPNDASFDLCWSCSLPRGEAAARFPQEPLPTVQLADEATVEGEDGNPYRSPHWNSTLGGGALASGDFGELDSRHGARRSLLFLAVLIASTIAALLYGGI